MFLVDRNEYKRVNFSMCRQHEFYVPICCCERIYLRFKIYVTKEFLKFLIQFLKSNSLTKDK